MMWFGSLSSIPSLRTKGEGIAFVHVKPTPCLASVMQVVELCSGMGASGMGAEHGTHVKVSVLAGVS